MLKDKLGIDEKDAKILAMFMQNADVSQTELAESLKLSQPSVNVRVRKLKERGILAQSVGIEFNRTDMLMARVDFAAPDAEKVLDDLRNCSFFVNGFVMSGKNNASILIVGHDLKKIDSIVNRHLRSDKDISEIDMSVVVATAKPFICSIDVEKESSEVCSYPSCEKCPKGRSTDKNKK